MVVVGFDAGFFACDDEGADEGASSEEMAVVDCDAAIGRDEEEARMMLLLRVGKMRLAGTGVGMVSSIVSKDVVVGI